jgi:3-hydroxyisobutyrate dehydrogenase-like beta-hydroxyacid dehydrogenase
MGHGAKIITSYLWSRTCATMGECLQKWKKLGLKVCVFLESIGQQRKNICMNGESIVQEKKSINVEIK